MNEKRRDGSAQRPHVVWCVCVCVCCVRSRCCTSVRALYLARVHSFSLFMTSYGRVREATGEYACVWS